MARSRGGQHRSYTSCMLTGPATSSIIAAQVILTKMAFKLAPTDISAIKQALDSVPKGGLARLPQLDMSAIAKAHADAMTVFPAFQKQLQESLKPLANLQ